MLSILAACLANRAGDGSWADGDHQLDAGRDRREGGGGGPGVERGLLDALDVVEVEFGDQVRSQPVSRCAG
jgi:hypothetical protein